MQCREINSSQSADFKKPTMNLRGNVWVINIPDSVETWCKPISADKRLIKVPQFLMFLEMFGLGRVHSGFKLGFRVLSKFVRVHNS